MTHPDSPESQLIESLTLAESLLLVYVRSVIDRFNDSPGWEHFVEQLDDTTFHDWCELRKRLDVNGFPARAVQSSPPKVG